MGRFTNSRINNEKFIGLANAQTIDHPSSSNTSHNESSRGRHQRLKFSFPSRGRHQRLKFSFPSNQRQRQDPFLRNSIFNENRSCNSIMSSINYCKHKRINQVGAASDFSYFLEYKCQDLHRR